MQPTLRPFVFKTRLFSSPIPLLQIFSPSFSQLSLADHSARFSAEPAFVGNPSLIAEKFFVQSLRQDSDALNSSLDADKLASKDAERQLEGQTVFISAPTVADRAVEKQLFSVKAEFDSLKNLNEQRLQKAPAASQERDNKKIHMSSDAVLAAMGSIATTKHERLLPWLSKFGSELCLKKMLLWRLT